MPVFEARDGAKIHYLLAGKGKPLLFLHGWAMSARVWKHQVDFFAERSMVIYPDLPGHGASDAPPGVCDFESLTGNIAEFIREMGMESVTLIGWSMGASLAILLAAARKLPIEALVLIDGTPSFMMRDDFPHGLPVVSLRRMLKLVERDFDRALSEFHGLLLSAEERNAPSAVDILDLLMDQRYRPCREAARGLLVSLAYRDLREHLDGIDVPCLLLHGAQDAICPVGAAAYMRDRLARAEMCVFPGAGHAPFLTRADACNRALATFLDAL